MPITVKQKIFKARGPSILPPSRWRRSRLVAYCVLNNGRPAVKGGLCFVLRHDALGVAQELREAGAKTPAEIRRVYNEIADSLERGEGPRLLDTSHFGRGAAKRFRQSRRFHRGARR